MRDPPLRVSTDTVSVSNSHSRLKAGRFFRVPLQLSSIMGFGSYDESEQENQQSDADYDDDEAINVHHNDHDGGVSFESEADQDELLDKLQQMKD